MKEAAPKVRRQYDPTFKREAVEHWPASGKSAEDIARELGISSGRLFSWRRVLLGPAASLRATPAQAASPSLICRPNSRPPPQLTVQTHPSTPNLTKTNLPFTLRFFEAGPVAMGI